MRATESSKLTEQIPFLVLETSTWPSGRGGKDFFIFIFLSALQNFLEDSSCNRKKEKKRDREVEKSGMMVVRGE